MFQQRFFVDFAQSRAAHTTRFKKKACCAPCCFWVLWHTLFLTSSYQVLTFWAHQDFDPTFLWAIDENTHVACLCLAIIGGYSPTSFSGDYCKPWSMWCLIFQPNIIRWERGVFHSSCCFARVETQDSSGVPVGLPRAHCNPLMLGSDWCPGWRFFEIYWEMEVS